ncbi:MAG TPA: response regulator [Ruminiclostridium sp.]|nr:response regulator [Ruminiclostridium sp.]
MPGKKNILLVEDNPADRFLVHQLFEDLDIQYTLHAVTDGLEALQFLRKEGIYNSAPDPDLVMLDLNLPKLNGKDVLKEIKMNENWKKIPVLVLSTSDDKGDIIDSYKMHANSYIVKPAEYDRYLDIMKNIRDYWFGATQLPPE